MEDTKTDNAFQVVFIGGGAASFFAAINLAELRPDLRLVILERSQEVLSKVKISGGGRCNVTHAIFDPMELTGNYPRGQKELLGPFNRFMTGDTVTWFEDRGVPLKIEEDGRMFPESDSSQSIIDCFLNKVNTLGIQIHYGQNVQQLCQIENKWQIITKKQEYTANAVFCGSGSSPKMWQLLATMGYHIVPAVPSLFTFNIKDPLLQDLQGISALGAVTLLDNNGKAYLATNGPVLITHWGISGPAVLKLSAWGAVFLASLAYNFTVAVNWVDGLSNQVVLETLKSVRKLHGLQKPFSRPQFGITKRLWQRIIMLSNIDAESNWADLSNLQLESLSHMLTAYKLKVNGKSTFKEEFVTAGGVGLQQINFKKFESRIHSNLYFAGEVLNIDAVTGGFNFQNAWTGGYLAANHMATNLKPITS